jgi:glyoxylase-like metal-dependent hydrolase (beta-lactamase superfamily II)
MRRAAVLAVLVVVGAVAMAATDQATPPQTQNVAEIEKVKDNLYVIKGGGGNTAAFITARGVVVVDTKLANWGQAILDKIRSVTDKPVTMIINTHTHGDHVGSNNEFPPTVEIVAHENTKANMEKMPAFQGDNAKFLPKRTYKDTLSLLDGNDRIDLYYFGPGHTSGDTIVVWPFLRTAHTGDLFAARATPLIDTNNGGSGVEYPKTIVKAAAGIAGVDVVIPGHSGVTDWKAFQEFADFNRDFLAAVEASMKAGKSADDAAAALQLPERWKDYGMGRVKANVAAIYAELKK